MVLFRISAQSRPTTVAGAIAGVIREEGRVEVQAIGAAAVNQAIKAVVIARRYLATDEIAIVCIPSFVEVTIEGEVRTAIKLTVQTPEQPLPPITPRSGTAERNL